MVRKKQLAKIFVSKRVKDVYIPALARLVAELLMLLINLFINGNMLNKYVSKSL